MARSRVLITGGSGLLALNWACAIRDRYDVLLATHTRRVALAGTHAVPLALDDAGPLERELQRLAPDIVIHTAGVTSVEACENDPEGARHVYEDLSRNVARAAAGAGAKLIQISTDHLFPGTRSMYREDDAPAPVNVYGQVKRRAEETVLDATPGALVVRTNFFGWGHRYRQSFSDWIYDGLSEGRSLTMFDDVWVTPILAERLALASHRLLDLGAAGIYNVVGDERISKYAFGVVLAQVFGLPAENIVRGTLAASKLSVKRPPDMSLDNRKARERLGASLGNPLEDLQLLAAQLRSGRREELLSAVTE